jgi:hypothetical protein
MAIQYVCNGSKPAALLSTAKKAGRDRKVTFNKQVKVTAVTHLNNFSDEEIERCWYEKADFLRIKEEFMLTVKLMNWGDLPKDTLGYCIRGTEFQTHEGARRRKLNKEVARDTVRDEQDEQWDEGIFDPDVLVSVYIAATRQCRVEAQLMGLEDEKDARESDAAVLHDISKPSNIMEAVGSPLRVNKNMRPLRRISVTSAAFLSSALGVLTAKMRRHSISSHTPDQFEADVDCTAATSDFTFLPREKQI